MLTAWLDPSVLDEHDPLSRDPELDLYRDGRVHAGIAAVDKERIDLPGDHYFQDPPDARDAVADVVADWVSSRV